MEQIDLARAPITTLGRLTLHPAVRQIVRDDGAEEVIEPRVMQVLLALIGAEGAIVTREVLTERCWDGRIVGEDAITRVISRLRRLQEGIGAGSFRLETVTKIGYRLRAGDAPVSAAAVLLSPSAGPVGRRTMVFGSAAAAAAAAIGGAALIYTHDSSVPLPRDVAALAAQGELALRQASPDGLSSAIGLYRRVTALKPDYADGWGGLAEAYAMSAHYMPAANAVATEARARDAIQRALALDPGNAAARLAKVMLAPPIGHALEGERLLRGILADHPTAELAQLRLAQLLAAVGRCREEATLLDQLAAVSTPTPSVMFTHVLALWAAGRLEEADRAMQAAFEIAPKHYAIWFTRFYLLLYTGRAQDAIAMANDVSGRPNGIPEANFTSVIMVAQAVLSRAPADVEAAIGVSLDMAHRGAGLAENSIQFAAALGRLDTAFTIADGYFFSRGFSTSDLRFSPEQGVYTRRSERRTYILFLPSTAAMRRDPRFDPLVTELGLARYWREAGVTPDYRR